MEEARWVVYKEYKDGVRYYAGKDLHMYNRFVDTTYFAKTMTLARARKMAKELGGKYRKI